MAVVVQRLSQFVVGQVTVRIIGEVGRQPLIVCMAMGGFDQLARVVIGKTVLGGVVTTVIKIGSTVDDIIQGIELEVLLDDGITGTMRGEVVISVTTVS